MRKLIISIKYFLFSFILSGLIFSNVIAETSQSKNFDYKWNGKKVSKKIYCKNAKENKLNIYDPQKYIERCFDVDELILEKNLSDNSKELQKKGNSISFKDYNELFVSYGIKDSSKIKKISDKCIKKFGAENFTIVGKGFEAILKSEFKKQFLTCTNFEILQKIKPKQGNNLKKSKLEEFILNNEITFDDNSGKGILTYVFNKNGYEAFKDDKKIFSGGWKWNNVGQLRVIMDDEKTTWKIAKNLQALSIKRKKFDKVLNQSTDKTSVIPYFFKYEHKNFAKIRRETEKRIIEEKKIAEKKRIDEEKRLEEKKIAEKKRIAEEKLLAEKNKIAEKKRIAEEKRLAEEKRIKEEKRKAEEKRIAKEEKISKEKELKRNLALIPEYSNPKKI